MKFNSTLFIATSIFLLVACQKDQAESTQSEVHAPTPAVQVASEQEPQTGRVYGKITEIIDIAGYTYVQVDNETSQAWAAGPTTPVKKGDMIAFDTGMTMRNFHSKSLNRDFEVLYFVDRFITDKPAASTDADPSAEAGHDPTSQPHGQITQQQPAKPVKGIKKVENGNTIAEIFAHKNNLKDKPIKVRGKVTKFTSGVLGKNWIHIRDSSTLDDLTITTDGTLEVGDIVIAEGNLGLDKDFGYGYVYPVIVEDAKVTKE